MSSNIRRLLLPIILEKIYRHPIVGSGFGETIVYRDPATHTMISTRQFDWGFLEIWTKMGLLGIIASLTLVLLLLWSFWKLKNARLFVALSAVAIQTVTMPALFHVFGVFFLIYCIILSNKKPVDIIAG